MSSYFARSDGRLYSNLVGVLTRQGEAHARDQAGARDARYAHHGTDVSMARDTGASIITVQIILHMLKLYQLYLDIHEEEKPTNG